MTIVVVLSLGALNKKLKCAKSNDVASFQPSFLIKKILTVSLIQMLIMHWSNARHDGPGFFAPDWTRDASGQSERNGAGDFRWQHFISKSTLEM